MKNLSTKTLSELESLRESVRSCARNRRGRRMYPKDLKRRIVDTIAHARDEGIKLQEIAEVLEISPHVLSQWVRPVVRGKKPKASLQPIEIVSDKMTKSHESGDVLPCTLQIKGSPQAIASLLRHL